MRLCKVNGNSMRPFIRDEDLVIIQEVPLDKIKRGNILVFQGANDQFFVHRLVGKRDNGILSLKGDGYNLSKDIITYDELAGKAVGLVRNGNLIRFSRSLEWYFWINARLREFMKNLLRGKISIHR